MGSKNNSADREIFGSKLGEILLLSLKNITEVNKVEATLVLEEVAKEAPRQEQIHANREHRTYPERHGTDYDPMLHNHILVTEGRIIGY